MTDFYEGQLVVCIANSGRWKGRSADLNVMRLPKLNGVYTIREFVEGGAGVRLKEIENRPQFFRDNDGELYGLEPSFGIEHFRPLDEKRTELFRSMLVTPPKKKVPV